MVNPGKHKERADLLKIRVRITQPMRRSEMLEAIRETLRTGVVQPGIVLEMVRWDHAVAGEYRTGKPLDTAQRNQLESAFRALVQSDVRLERLE
jgi:hypothetical protein